MTDVEVNISLKLTVSRKEHAQFIVRHLAGLAAKLYPSNLKDMVVTYRASS